LLRFREALFHGALVTIELTLVCIVCGTVVGLLLALGRQSSLRVVKVVSVVVIEWFRALPLLVLLVWIYYCLPIVSGVRLSGFLSAALALSLNLAAFAAETFRAGIESIPAGYMEAARAVGFSKARAMRRIILPQVSRQMLPPLVGLYITMLKLSSLASVLAVQELLHAGSNIISATYRPLEVYTAIALIYVLMVLPGLWWSQNLETSVLLSRGAKSMEESP
jgi:His/Glu/Gln/Arg/opine family amino acid ABC transporter permease subunit